MLAQDVAVTSPPSAVHVFVSNTPTTQLNDQRIIAVASSCPIADTDASNHNTDHIARRRKASVFIEESDEDDGTYTNWSFWHAWKRNSSSAKKRRHSRVQSTCRDACAEHIVVVSSERDSDSSEEAPALHASSGMFGLSAEDSAIVDAMLVSDSSSEDSNRTPPIPCQSFLAASSGNNEEADTASHTQSLQQSGNAPSIEGDCGYDAVRASLSCELRRASPDSGDSGSDSDSGVSDSDINSESEDEVIGREDNTNVSASVDADFRYVDEEFAYNPQQNLVKQTNTRIRDDMFQNPFQSMLVQPEEEEPVGSPPCVSGADADEDEEMLLEDQDQEQDEVVTASQTFNPYMFIAQLPAQPPVTFSSPRLPPKDASSPPVTLVLDLDETLLHGAVVNNDPEATAAADYVITVREQAQSDAGEETVEYTLGAKKRPHMEEFLRAVSGMFEVVVFTASQQQYAGKLLDLIDPDKTLIKHRLFREACVFSCGNYMKDLSVLGRDLSKILLLDNSPHTYGFQIDNGIPIESWYGNDKDEELAKLLPVLRKLAACEDVRPIVHDEFQTHKLVDAYRSAMQPERTATTPSSTTSL